MNVSKKMWRNFAEGGLCMAPVDGDRGAAAMVVLADPLALARRGLRGLLSDCGAACTIEEACDGAKALALMRHHGEGIALVSHRPPPGRRGAVADAARRG